MQVMLGQSQVLERARSELSRCARCDAAVLIEGETGTGKEIAAREIHYASARASGPFVPVNCGALPDTLIENELFGHRRGAFTDARQAQPGLVELADGGSLFLDEVDSLSSKAQVALLRFLQDKEYRPIGGSATQIANVRILAASNACLDLLAEAGRFRRDLHYRLNALYVRLPPLRERAGDVPLLARYFLATVARQLGFPAKRWSDAALAALCTYAWPGNVRQLENLALRACLHADGNLVGLDDIGLLEPALGVREPAPEPAIGQAFPASFAVAKRRAVAAFEREYLTQVMRRANGNVSEAARLCGTERRQFGKLLKKHGIERAPYRST